MQYTIGDGRKFRLLSMIDGGSPEALPTECGCLSSFFRLLRVLAELIELYGRPRAIRMDNGMKATSAKIAGRAEQIDLQDSQPGKPKMNAFAERVNRSFRQEGLHAWRFDSLPQAQQILKDGRIAYKAVRSHESLGKKTTSAYL